MLGKQAERSLARLIGRWGLHDDTGMIAPVPIRQVARDEGWKLIFMDGIYPLYAFALVRGALRWMVVNSGISREWQRVAIAHELGHVINNDLPELHFCSEGEWLWNKQERRATQVAARILIPDHVLQSCATVAEVAAICGVPEEVVTIRLTSIRYEPSGTVFL